MSHWKNDDPYCDIITVENIRFKLVFSDIKTGKALDAQPLCVLNKEIDGVNAKIVIEASDKLSAYFDMCAAIADDIAKRGIPDYINRWRWAESDCKFQISKWQRLIDAGEVKVELVSEEFTTREKKPHRIRY